MSALSKESPPPRIIILIGLMGAGKTTLGRLLAQRYGIPFIDTDVEVEKAAGASVADIFSQHGEAFFREGEYRVINRLLNTGPCVLATGGGAWMNEKTRQAIRNTPSTCTVWLHVPVDVILKRLHHSRNTRPLLQHQDPRDTLTRLAHQRYPLYAQANITVHFGEESMDQGVQAIHDALQNFIPPQRVHVHLSHHSYDILIGSALLERAASLLVPHLKSRHAFIITDETVAPLHLKTLESAISTTDSHLTILRIPPGEGSKSLQHYSTLMEKLLTLGIDRHTTIIALGGGVVGDLAGFIAATALRGLPFIQIPTTLLAQVDSSVGGKTGINATAGKNLIGAFWQPHLVLADTNVLTTLPRRQLVAGYAEIVKSGLIADLTLFEWCEHHGQAVLDGDHEKLEEAVHKACVFKTRIVTQDEREQASSGGRALLNLGHTFAHAFEAEFHYDGRLLHGEAVSIGLHMALALSVRMGFAPKKDLIRLDNHLHALSMPCHPSDLPHPLKADDLIAHMMHDKKAYDGRIKFVLLHGIGKAFTHSDINMTEVKALLKEEGCL
ncbi:3-dehydroquinate synthase [Saccharibacter sp. 17.LH.SD]|uniref:3-dehydroquinate synthase n=1 Tax=Saccharibacter sp. 17.LH.SD TaxID=2689393 RepID=UPI0013705CC4|nr:3-dehydroquinate synthase [Saccharibacter sp. 17.LH.SD]MXV44069.1 3-dehydroquinate synthase [Saccharibacter sp. 17.LH.SD]